MAILNLSLYWQRLGDSPADAPANCDGRHALPPNTQVALDDGGIRSTRSTPGYAGRHRVWDGETGVTGSTPAITAIRNRRSAESERRYAASLLAREGAPDDDF